MIEIIKRHNSFGTAKEQVSKGKAQISYNSDGRLVING